MNTSQIDGLVIENVALSFLASIKEKYLKALEKKETASLSNSEIAYKRFLESIDSLLGMIKSKDIKQEDKNKIKDLKKRLEAIEDDSDLKIKEKVKALKEILEEIEELISSYRWFDMPKQSERGFDLIKEFYGE